MLAPPITGPLSFRQLLSSDPSISDFYPRNYVRGSEGSGGPGVCHGRLESFGRYFHKVGCLDIGMQNLSDPER